MIREIVQAMQEIDYLFEEKVGGYRAGAHTSERPGAGLQFKRRDWIINHPNLSRVDWLATKRTRSPIPLVRVFEQENAIDVIIIVDLTASMGFIGITTKMEEVAKLAACLAYSAYRTGDRFGFLGYEETLKITILPSFAKATANQIGEILWHWKASGQSPSGLTTVVDYLPRRPALIFWISDFYDNELLTREFLEAATKHDIVPIILNDPNESNLPKFGPLHLLDPETHQKRTLFLTPRLRQKIIADLTKQRENILGIFREFDRKAMIITGSFQPRQLAHFFEQRK